MGKSKSSSEDEGLKIFKRNKFDGNKSKFNDFNQEIKENLRSESEHHLWVLFPANRTPYNLDANNIPTNSPDSITIKQKQPDIVIGRQITQDQVDARIAANAEIEKHNNKVYEIYAFVRKTIATRISKALLNVLSEINDNRLLYHFWTREIVDKYGANANTQLAKGIRFVKSIFNPMKTEEHFNAYIADQDLIWDELKIPDDVRVAILLSDGSYGPIKILPSRLDDQVKHCILSHPKYNDACAYLEEQDNNQSHNKEKKSKVNAITFTPKNYQPKNNFQKNNNNNFNGNNQNNSHQRKNNNNSNVQGTKRSYCTDCGNSFEKVLDCFVRCMTCHHNHQNATDSNNNNSNTTSTNYQTNTKSNTRPNFGNNKNNTQKYKHNPSKRSRKIHAVSNLDEDDEDSGNEDDNDESDFEIKELEDSFEYNDRGSIHVIESISQTLNIFNTPPRVRKIINTKKPNTLEFQKVASSINFVSYESNVKKVSTFYMQCDSGADEHCCNIQHQKYLTNVTIYDEYYTCDKVLL